MPATIPLDPVTALDAPGARWSVPNACRDAYYTLVISPVCRCAGRILSASDPPSSSAPPSNPHSARCTAGAQLPATSCLVPFWTPAATARGTVPHAGVQKPAQDRTYDTLGVHV